METVTTIKIRYGDDVTSESVKNNLTEVGIDLDDYIEFFGYPEEVRDMGVDPAWFTPPLPGMDKDTDYVATMAGAEDLLETKKREAFKRLLEEDKRWDGYNICLTEEEAETYMSDYENVQYIYQDNAQWVYDNVIELIKSEMLQGHPYWKVEGSNLTWRGGSGYKYMKLDNGKDVMSIFSSYGDYSLTVARDTDDVDFTASVTHHDCPVNGSFFKFIKITEEEYNNET